MNIVKKYTFIVICILITQAVFFTVGGAKGDGERTRKEINVTFVTSHGTISLELYPDDAPITVENFMKYYNDNFYEGLIFHRVIEDFMIQGGGFYPDLKQKTATYSAIKNEAAVSGHRNLRGTIAMARTSAPDSATCQFFINHVDNPSLDWDNPTGDGSGYCVFGRVTLGLDVVDSIAVVDTNTENGMGDVPVEDILITETGGDGNSGDDDDDEDDDTNGGNSGGYNPDKKPSNPRNVQIEAGDGYIEISWSKPLDNGAPPIYQYKIYRATSSGNLRQLAMVDASEKSYKDNTVENDQIYYYYVIAVNAYAESDPSFEVSETPQKGVEKSPGFKVISLLGITVIVAVWSIRKKK